jgi:hypothetical protein
LFLAIAVGSFYFQWRTTPDFVLEPYSMDAAFASQAG